MWEQSLNLNTWPTLIPFCVGAKLVDFVASGIHMHSDPPYISSLKKLNKFSTPIYKLWLRSEFLITTSHLDWISFPRTESLSSTQGINVLACICTGSSNDKPFLLERWNSISHLNCMCKELTLMLRVNVEHQFRGRKNVLPLNSAVEDIMLA